MLTRQRVEQIAASIEGTLADIDSGHAAATDLQASYLLGVADALTAVRGKGVFIPPILPRVDRD